MRVVAVGEQTESSSRQAASRQTPKEKRGHPQRQLGPELQEDVAAQKVPCGGRLGAARDELGCTDTYNVLVSFVCHEPPKWVLSLGYIKKTIASGLSHLRHVPLA